ncbi:A-kinase anchor protein 8 isoform 2-T2 [Leptodactylus fuscus]|uniref:A-kinase anchor protein 8 isoform X2 n=1 Tax=Leptodactylus fuscus TaxID=238119 RepID=UPI003F4E60EA
MDPRQWGGPGFPFPRGPGNFPTNFPFATNTPGLQQGFGMPSSNFPTHNRPPFHGDFKFAENPQMQGNSFWTGPGPSAPTPRMRPPLKKKMVSPTLKQLPKAEETVPDNANNPPETIKKFKKQRWRVRDRKRREAAAAYTQSQKAASQPPNSGGTAKEVQQPTAPSASQPANVENKEEKQTATPNGDTMKHEAPEQSRDSDATTPPEKKMKTEETKHPSKHHDVLKSFPWLRDTSKLFSCSLCRFYSPEEHEILKHFCSNLHNSVLQHLRIFFPRERVNLLHEYLKFKRKEMSMKPKDVVKQKGTYQDQYFHRVQAMHCQACDVLIPDVSNLLQNHTKSEAHKKNCKLIYSSIKVGSVPEAKALLVNTDFLQFHRKFSQGQNPKPAGSSLEESSTHDILVPEEDDDEEEDTVEDATCDTIDGEDLPIDHSEDETRDSDSLERNPVLPEMVEPDHMTTETSAIAVNTDETMTEEETEEEEAAEAP